jgi:hypothetical protein
MSNTTWQKPVTVTLPGTGRVEISGPFEALALLTEGWPTMAGRHFIRARVSCKAALDDRMSPEQARREFEQAVREANTFLN